jgi:hypothetical protein
MTDPGSTMASDATAGAEAAVQRIRDLTEQFIQSAKTAGNVSLDAYEKSLQNLVDFTQRMASGTPNELDWVSQIAQANAKFMQDITAAYVQAARDMLK